MESCAKHPHEIGAALCGRCGVAWCAPCLVYTHGSEKPPLCLECAMFAGGVRSSATRPALTRRQMKARLEQVEEALAASEAQVPTRHVVSASDDAPGDTSAAESSASDWSSPWWEDRQPTLAD